MFFLPARMGGLGIRDPIDLCDVDFDSSCDGVTDISAAIVGTTGLNILLVSMLLLFLVMKVSTLCMMESYT